MSIAQLPYFYENNIQQQSKGFILSESTSKHCVQVLRMQEGDQMQLTNGAGLLATATIKVAHKKHCQVHISDAIQTHPPDSWVTVAIAPTKHMNRTEWALEKLAEIGVNEIILMSTKRTERSSVNMERLEQILLSAMLQSRQVFSTRLSGLSNFENVVKYCETATHKWIAHCLDTGPKSTLKKAAGRDPTVILIGPEGDFTDSEIDFALKNNYQPVTLGPTRLRTETATLVAGVLLKLWI